MAFYPINPERGAWSSVMAGWRQVYGSFTQLGASVEMHDFRAEQPLDWARSFHPGSVEICLNLAGRGEVGRGGERTVVTERSSAFYINGSAELAGHRNGGETHRFVTLELSREFVTRQLAGLEDAAHPVLRKGLLGTRIRSGVSEARNFAPGDQLFAHSLCEPPVAAVALPIWYQSKVLEAVAHFFFAPGPELFCSRQKRLARERVEHVEAILRARLENPPTLEELGREVGVSPFYLSRIFSAEMQMTIPQMLRRLRMERAAELLLEGRHNVTEAAFAVGYSSLGHFSKSFCEVIGCCPTLYPHARHLVRSVHVVPTGSAAVARRASPGRSVSS